MELPDGNWYPEYMKLLKQAEEMEIAEGETLEADLPIDDDFPPQVKDQIREYVRQELEKKTGAAVRMKGGIKRAVEERLQKVEDRTNLPDLPEPAIWARLQQLEREVEKLKKE